MKTVLPVTHSPVHGSQTEKERSKEKAHQGTHSEHSSVARHRNMCNSNWEKKTAVDIKEPAAKEARGAVSSGGPGK